MYAIKIDNRYVGRDIKVDKYGNIKRHGPLVLTFTRLYMELFKTKEEANKQVEWFSQFANKKVELLLVKE